MKDQQQPQEAARIEEPEWLPRSRRVWCPQKNKTIQEPTSEFALVVKPKIKGVRLSKTLMDGGSTINILFYKTFKRMKLHDSLIWPKPTTFFGIIPHSAARSIGRVELRVTFGERRNSRKERIIFEVVDLRSAYRCILGRTAFKKFRARP